MKLLIGLILLSSCSLTRRVPQLHMRYCEFIGVQAHYREGKAINPDALFQDGSITWTIDNMDCDKLVVGLKYWISVPK
jgi:hypothetical protein